MKSGLLKQLDTYFDQVDADQPPVTEMQVRELLNVTPARRPRIILTVPRGLALAGAVGLAVLLIGLVPLLLQDEETGSADTLDPTPNTIVTGSTVATPTTEPAPPTTLAETGFAPRVDGSGVDVAFSITPSEMSISGETFVLLEAEWSIDWEGMVWEWGDDEIRQRIVASYRGNNTHWLEDIRTLVVQKNADMPVGEDTIARFALTFTGTSENFEIHVHEEASGEALATIKGSLPGLDEDQILARSAGSRPAWGFPGRAGWFFAQDENGELSPINPPWESLYGESLYGWSWLRDPFFQVGDTTLALFATNLWSSTDGRTWIDHGHQSWLDETDSLEVFDNLLYRHGWSHLTPGPRDSVLFWVSADGLEWTELNQDDYEAATGLDVYTTHPDDLPEAPDWEDTSGELLAQINDYFSELTRDAIVISENPRILQLRPGPEPRFDTSDLGKEIEFVPLDPDSPHAQWLKENYAEERSPRPHTGGAVLFVGQIPDSALTTPRQDMSRYDAWEVFWAKDCDETCLGVGGLQAAGSLTGEISVHSGGREGLIAVPLHTSVVMVRYNTDVVLWQRPTGGWAVFPVSVDGDDTFWVDIYDADGNLIDSTERR